MDEALLFEKLAAMRQRSYPLTLTYYDAEALIQAIGVIMDVVPDDDRVLVRGHYNLVTAAIYHPEPIAPWQLDQPEGSDAL